MLQSNYPLKASTCATSFGINFFRIDSIPPLSVCDAEGQPLHAPPHVHAGHERILAHPRVQGTEGAREGQNEDPYEGSGCRPAQTTNPNVHTLEKQLGLREGPPLKKGSPGQGPGYTG